MCVCWQPRHPQTVQPAGSICSCISTVEWTVTKRRDKCGPAAHLEGRRGVLCCDSLLGVRLAGPRTGLLRGDQEGTCGAASSPPCTLPVWLVRREMGCRGEAASAGSSWGACGLKGACCACCASCWCSRCVRLGTRRASASAGLVAIKLTAQGPAGAACTAVPSPLGERGVHRLAAQQGSQGLRVERRAPLLDGREALLQPGHLCVQLGQLALDVRLRVPVR